MASNVTTSDESWRDLLADEPIIYSDTELIKLRQQNKLKWRKKLNILFESKQFKDSWNWKGSENFSVAPFESHHKKEVLDMISYQFSSCGNNTFHKILNTPVGALYNGCEDCLDHICLTGLGYVLLDKYNHIEGVFYGWDLRDEPIWKNKEKYHAASNKEDEIIKKANYENDFAKNIFETNKECVEYGSVYFGEILCIKPHLMHNGWFTKLSFNISIIFGMDYDVYYDFDFQPSRHLYKDGVFDNFPHFIKDSILRYDLFYFGDFEFSDGSKMSDNYAVLKKQYKFKDVDNLRNNAFVGCFVLRNSTAIRQFFENDFLKCFECVRLIRSTQETLLMQLKKKNEGLWSYCMFLLNIYWNAIRLFIFSIGSNKKIKVCAQIIVAMFSIMCLLILL